MSSMIENQGATRPPQGLYAGYSETYRPLNGYLALMGIYAAAAVACGVALRRSKRKPPIDEVKVKDIVALGVATHKLSRIVAHDEVTSPLRAPFSHLEEETGASELRESTRGRGLRAAVGDLLTCPWCLGPWVGGALMAGYLFFPRGARAVTTLFSAVAVSDFLNIGYDVAKRKRAGESEKKG